LPLWKLKKFYLHRADTVAVRLIRFRSYSYERK
jgi:hypothetical protein